MGNPRQAAAGPGVTLQEGHQSCGPETDRALTQEDPAGENALDIEREHGKPFVLASIAL